MCVCVCEIPGLRFTVPGKPKGKKSVAEGPHGPYNPSSNEMRKFEAIVRATKKIPEECAKYRGPLKIHTRAYFARPLSHLKRHNKGLKSSAPRAMTNKPDADNIAKFVGDCLTGLAYRDDSQIVSNTSEKFWCVRNERVEVELKHLQ